MIQSILIYDPTGRELGALREAFQVEVRPEDEVHLIDSIRELLRRVADRSRSCLVVLPDSSGADLLRRVRRENPEVPVVICADRGSVEKAARAVAAGASEFLVTGERLRERIATLLGKLRGLTDALERNRTLDEQNARLREAIQA